MNKRTKFSIIFKPIFLKLRVEITGQEQGLKQFLESWSVTMLLVTTLIWTGHRKVSSFLTSLGKTYKKVATVKKDTLKNRPPGQRMWLSDRALTQYVQGSYIWSLAPHTNVTQQTTLLQRLLLKNKIKLFNLCDSTPSLRRSYPPVGPIPQCPIFFNQEKGLLRVTISFEKVIGCYSGYKWRWDT